MREGTRKESTPCSRNEIGNNHLEIKSVIRRFFFYLRPSRACFSGVTSGVRIACRKSRGCWRVMRLTSDLITRGMHERSRASLTGGDGYFRTNAPRSTPLLNNRNRNEKITRHLTRRTQHQHLAYLTTSAVGGPAKLASAAFAIWT